jgi:hypothetical protein
VQRGRLDDRERDDGLAIGRRRADEDVLPGATGERLDVGGDLLRGERPEVHHRVEVPLADGRRDARGVAGIADHVLRAVDRRARRLDPAIEQGQLVPLVDGKAAAGGTDDAVAADEQDLHRVRSFRWGWERGLPALT